MSKTNFRKTIFSTTIIMILLVLSITFTSVFEKNNTARAIEESQNNVMYTNADQKSDLEHVYVDLPKEHILIADSLVVPFIVESKYEITDCSYTSIGFNVLSSNAINEHRIDFELECISGFEKYVLSVNIELSSNKKKNIELYAYCNENDVFFSSYAPDDAFEKYLDYEMTKNRLTDNQADVIRRNYWKDSVTEDGYNTATSSDRNLTSAIKNQLKSIRNKILNGQIATLDDSADTYITGKLEWIDDAGNIHPIRRVAVEICDYDSSLVSEVLGTVFTDNDGNYSFAFKNKDQLLDFENGGYDLL